MTAHFLQDDDLSPAEQADVLRLAEQLRGSTAKSLAGKAVALIFEKASLRTRASFEVGIAQLGGQPIVIDAQTTHFSRGEAIEDAARVLSRYVDAIVMRTYSDARLRALAGAATVPVVNALTDGYHPCQILADLLTIKQHRGGLAGRTLAYVGDGGNNMAHSYLIGGALAGLHVRIGAPRSAQPDPAVVERALNVAALSGGSVLVSSSPAVVEQADVVATDAWTSMGQPHRADRLAALQAFQVNDSLLALARPDAIVLHCLPAHRGAEITDAVLDGPRSVVLDQAENRLHVQKALLCHLQDKSAARRFDGVQPVVGSMVA
jgi:ornithine carbamoyltransferase